MILLYYRTDLADNAVVGCVNATRDPFWAWPSPGFGGVTQRTYCRPLQDLSHLLQTVSIAIVTSTTITVAQTLRHPTYHCLLCMVSMVSMVSMVYQSGAKCKVSLGLFRPSNFPLCIHLYGQTNAP